MFFLALSKRLSHQPTTTLLKTLKHGSRKDLTKSFSLVKQFSRNFSSSPSDLKEELTPFVKHLQARIRIQGSLSLSDYMKECLTNPLCGYYMHKDVFGTVGDFITAPEVSQTFGECIGVFFLHHWLSSGEKHTGINLVELGPGRGTLMSDLLRTISISPKFMKSIDGIHMVECSPAQRFKQRATLCPTKNDNNMAPLSAHDITEDVTKQGLKIKWHSRVEDLPNGPIFLVANEFFDALPVHQFEYTEKGWCEVLIDLDTSHESPLNFKYSISRDPTLYSSLFVNNDLHKNPKIGQRIEVSPESWGVVTEITKKIHDNGGCALLIDYGEDKTQEDTLRAIKAHKFQNALSNPGQADLSADVDFSYLRAAATTQEKKVNFSNVITQGQFLSLYGIRERTEALIKSNPEHRKEFIEAYTKLTSPKLMGQKYKVAALTSLDTQPPF